MTQIKEIPEEFIRQFKKLESYRKPRTFNEVIPDFMALYQEDKELAVKFIFYMRMINRTVDYIDGESTLTPQFGVGLKHESKLRMMALSIADPDLFWNNIGLFISAGSWKDIFDILRNDLAANPWDKRILNWNKFGELIQQGLDNPNTSDYVKKYMPLIKSKKQCKTVRAENNVTIGKWLCCLMFGNKDDAHFYKKYRMVKVGGKKHKWQQQISQQRYDLINFNEIHGKALYLMNKGKSMRNPELHKKFTEWKNATEIRKTKNCTIKTFDKSKATVEELFLHCMDQELLNKIKF